MIFEVNEIGVVFLLLIDICNERLLSVLEFGSILSCFFCLIAYLTDSQGKLRTCCFCLK